MLPHLKIKRLYKDAKLPTRGTDKAIGLDLYAYFPVVEEVREYDKFLEKNNQGVVAYTHSLLKVSTGIAVAIPDGYYGRIAPRSGLALKYGIDVLAGVVDSDYRGELIVLLTCLVNTGEYPKIKHGDRIAQLIIERADILPIEEVSEFDDTYRGAGGFGSTGRN